MCSAGPFFSFYFWRSQSFNLFCKAVRVWGVSSLCDFFFFFSNADLFDYVLKITIKTVLGGKKTCWKVLFVSRMKSQLLWLHVQNIFLSCLCNINRNWTRGQLYCHLSLYHKMVQWVNVMLMKPGELKGLSHTGLEASRKPAGIHSSSVYDFWAVAVKSTAE